jgi:Flp pilus assembly protein protease CpaA
MGDVVTSDIFNKILGGLLVAFIVAAFVKRDPVFKNTEEE